MQQSGITTGTSSSGEIGAPLPVTGKDAVDILINDHQTIKTLLSKFVTASSSDRQAALDRLKAALTVHNATEENLVYPAIDKIAHRHGETKDLYHETSEADIAIFELDTLIKQGVDTDVDAKATALQQAVLEHIENEESSAFRHLRESADETESSLLTQAVRQFRRSLSFTSSV